MATKYFSCSETAKMVRQALKEAFPGGKFSVKSKTYRGGASINVNWTDGPNNAQVEAVANVFEGGYFDGMTDYKGSVYSMVDCEVVKFGADFIFCNRDYSDKAIQRGIDRFYAKYVGNFSQFNIAKPTVEQYRRGDLWTVQVIGQGYPYDRNVQQGVNELLYKNSDRMAVKKSSTASNVIYLGNDGYSQVGALNAEAVEQM